MHSDGTAEALALIEKCVGRHVTAVRRVRYVHRGAVLEEHGIVEFTFDDGQVRCLDAGHDGERLTVRDGRWVDPFAEPLSDENREFVRVSGKWTAFEIDERDELWQVVGEVLEDVEPLWQFGHTLVGVGLTFGRLSLVAKVVADTLRLTWETAAQ